MSLVLLAGLFGGCISDGREELLKKVEAYLEQKNTAAAARILETYLIQAPDDSAAKELKARYYHMTDQYLLEAETYYQLIKQIQGANKAAEPLERYYLACAEAYLQLGYREDALEIYREGSQQLASSALLKEKAEALAQELYPPPQKAKLALTPDESGVYAMTEPGEKTTLTLVFSGLRSIKTPETFERVCKDFETQTGHSVVYKSLPSGIGLYENKEGKAEKNGDLLFISSRQELARLAAENQLVSLKELRALLPQLGEHNQQALLPAAPDGEYYLLPVSTVWTGLYLNKTVLEECGVTLPAEGYDWEQFLNDCEKIKAKGYPAIAASLPKDLYPWLALCLINHENEASRTSQKDAVAAQRAAAMEEVRQLYENGCFMQPQQEQRTPLDLLVKGEAAFFLGDHSTIRELEVYRAQETQRLWLAPAPLQHENHAGKLIGDFSAGWAITRAAWDDPDKRLAALSLYSCLTSAAVQKEYTGKSGEWAPLKEQAGPEEENESARLQKIFFAQLNGVCFSELSLAPPQKQKEWVETILPQVLSGELLPAEAAEKVAETLHAQESIEDLQ